MKRYLVLRPLSELVMRRSSRASILRGRPEPVYGCGNVPQTTAESNDISPIHCAQHVQQSVDMSIQLPAGLQYDPVQTAELRQQVQDAWDNLSQDDIRHLYDLLHARIHAWIAARGNYTVY